MKRLLLIFVTIVGTSCSLDNKTGIWKDAGNIVVDNQSPKTIVNDNSPTRYEDIITKKKTFNEEKENLVLLRGKIESPLKLVSWLEQYAIPTNNISNFSFVVANLPRPRLS